MQSVRSEVGGSPKHPASARARDFSSAVGPGRLRAVIRLPELRTGNSLIAEESAATPAVCDETVQVVEEALIPEEPGPQSEPSLEIESPCPPAADAAPATEAPAMLTATRPEHSKAETVPEAAAPAASSPGALASAWQLICRGHAFLMQPKIWLACVLSCMGLIVIVFYLQPRAEPEPASRAERALPRPPEPAPEPETSPTTQIVAPPAEISANDSGPHGLGLNPSAGFIPPLGEAASADGANATQNSDAETIRMAADPRLGGGSRYDGQGAAEPSGVRINNIGPLDVSEELNQEGGTLR
jgi:hypothetical protein